MAYSNEVKEKVLEALQQGKTANKINEETGVSLATINKWKKEAGLTKSRSKSKAEKQQAEVVEELESKEAPAEMREEQVAPEVIKREKQEKRQRIINRWKMAKFNGNDEEKVAVLKEWVELEPKNENLINLMVQYLIKLGRDKEAQQYEVPELENEKEAKSQGWRPVKIDGSVEEKVATLENLLKSEPKNLTSINQMTSLMTSLGRIEQAEEYQRRAEEINANDNYVLGNKIRICCKKRDFEQAKKVCKEAMQQYKIGSFFIMQLANIYQMQGKYKEAEEVLLQYKSRFVGNYEISRDLKLAEIYINTKEYEKAKELLEQASRKDKEGKYTSKVNCDLAWLEMKRGNFDKAKEILAKQDSQDDRVKVQYVQLLLTTGEYDEARYMIESITENKRKAIVFLARLEALQGNSKKAMQIIEEQDLIVEDKDYETMIIQRISFTKSTIKLLQREPQNENLINQLHSIYRMAFEKNDILLMQLIEREYGAIEITQDVKSVDLDSQEYIAGELCITDLYIEHLKEQIVEVTKKEDLDQVVEACNELMRIDPNNIEARKKLVQVSMLDGELDYAEGMCYEILNLCPEEIFAYESLLNIAEQKGDKQALKDMANAITNIDYLNISARKSLLEIAEEEQDDEAIKQLSTEILILDPKDLQTRYKCIQIAMKENNPNLLFQLLHEASKYNGITSIEQLANLAGRDKEKKTTLEERVIKETVVENSVNRPKVATVQVKPAQKMVAIPNPKEKLQEHQSPKVNIERSSNQPTIRRKVSEEELRKSLFAILEARDSGDRKKQIEAYTRRLELLPSDEKARMSLANLLIVRGNLQEAQRLLQEGLKINENNIYFLTSLTKIANIQKNKSESVRLSLKVLEHEPEDILALQNLLNNSEDKDRMVYATRIQELLKSGQYKGKIADIRRLEKDSRKYAVDITELEEKKSTNTKQDSISQFRAQIKQGNTTSEEAEQMLRELENDHSIRATALKAEIYLRVFSNPRGAKKLVDERSRLEGITSKEKSSLAQISEIIRRAEKGIAPRELETIR